MSSAAILFGALRISLYQDVTVSNGLSKKKHWYFFVKKKCEEHLLTFFWQIVVANSVLYVLKRTINP